MKTKISLCIALSAVTAALGADWPRWGGNDPGRNMYSPETGLPDHFTKDKGGRVEMKPGTEEIDTKNLPNAKWVAKLGSQSLRQRGGVQRQAFSSAPTTKIRAIRSIRVTEAFCFASMRRPGNCLAIGRAQVGVGQGE